MLLADGSGSGQTPLGARSSRRYLAKPAGRQRRDKVVRLELLPRLPVGRRKADKPSGRPLDYGSNDVTRQIIAIPICSALAP